MTDFWSFENSMMTGILLIVLGVVLALVIAPNVDWTIHTLRGMGFDSGAGTSWDSSSEFWVVHNIYVIFLYCPSPLGLIIILVGAAKRSRRDEISGYEAGAIYGIEE